MKILIDIGHPAHVHYFRNFIQIMQQQGHDFLVTARDKEVAHRLLDHYKIPYVNRGTGKNSLTGKIVYVPRADAILLKHARRFKPDLFMSFASPYAGHVARLTGKPHIALTDTDQARLGILSFAPFSSAILTPACFKGDFGHKHIRFNSYMELGYLAPAYFTPNPDIRKELKVGNTEKYIILRFVSWHANHDINQKGFSKAQKTEMVKMLSQYARVFISSEQPLTADLEPYRIHLPPQKLHDALAFAALYIGEGSTTASECVALGTPAIYVNSLNAGTLEEQAGYGLLYNYRTPGGVIEKALELLTMDDAGTVFREKRKTLLTQKIDPTAFLCWFMENYPGSMQTMREDVGYKDTR